MVINLENSTQSFELRELYWKLCRFNICSSVLLIYEGKLKSFGPGSESLYFWFKHALIFCVVSL